MEKRLTQEKEGKKGKTKMSSAHFEIVCFINFFLHSVNFSLKNYHPFYLDFYLFHFLSCPLASPAPTETRKKWGSLASVFFPAVRSFLSPFVSVSFLCAFIIEIAHDETFAKREKNWLNWLGCFCYCIDNESSRVKRSFSSYPWGETVVVKE